MYMISKSEKIVKIGLSAIVTAAVLTACGGGSSSSTVPAEAGYNGIFVDAAVGGISWACGGISGVTAIDGLFGECPAGSDVTFSVGNIVLGTVAPTSDYIFTPQDVVGVDRNDTADNDVQIMSALLLSLDSDGDPDNGIEITPEVITAFNTVTEPSTTVEDLNLTNSTDIEDLVTEINIEDSNLTLVAVGLGEAANHLDDTLIDIEDGTIPPPEQPTVITGATSSIK